MLFRFLFEGYFLPSETQHSHQTRQVDVLSLLQNLIIESRQACWRINLSIIEQQMTLLTGFPFNEETFDVPTLSLHGSKSDYLSAADLPIIKKVFPQAMAQSINDASHWLHVERPDEVARAIQGFLKKSTY